MIIKAILSPALLERNPEKHPWRILVLPASGRCLRATPAAPPAPVGSTPQQRAARCGATFRGLDRRLKMGEPGN
jgi:hypothetical protein